MRRHLFSILLPFLMVGACQPATAPDAESVATQLNGPPGDDDPPEPHGTINPPPRNLRVTSNVGGAVIEFMQYANPNEEGWF